MHHVHAIESILFVSSKPLSVKKIATLLELKVSDVESALDELVIFYASRGINLLRYEGGVQLVASPDASELVRQLVKDESSGELTRPALETLSVIAYRSPVTKGEIEQIRGVNCAQSLRNLLIRGLIESREDRGHGDTRYILSFDFLRQLGVQGVDDLPDYETLHAHARIEELCALDSVSPSSEANITQKT